MTVINTHQTIGLKGITHTVKTADERRLGTYFQEHGADTVISDELPVEDNGVVGPIEAIVTFAQSAGIRGFKLSEDGSKESGADLVAEVERRIADLGGQSKLYVSHLGEWACELGICPSDVVRVVHPEPSKELVA